MPATALLLVILTACGGGGGGTPESETASASSIAPDTGATQTEAVVEETVSEDELAHFAKAAGVTAVSPAAVSALDAGVVTRGWTDVKGPVLSEGGESGWLFQSQKVQSWPAGGVAVGNDSSGNPTSVLKFDFGCVNAEVTLRTRDCRNVVAMYQRAPANMVVDGATAVSMEVVNPDASVALAVRITDSTGQTLQYPFNARSLEQPSPWVLNRVYVPLKNPNGYWGGSNDGIPHGKISLISVVAAPLNSDSATTGLNYPAGRIEVRSIQLHNNFSLKYNLATNNAVAPGNFYPSYTNRLAVAHNKFDRAVLAKAKAAGFGVLRKDIFWEGVEIHGTWDFKAYNDGLATLASLGMKALWILDYVHPNHGGTPPTSPAQLSAFQKYAVEVARNSKGKAMFGYEIWNEPDQHGAWPNPNPVAYSTLLSQTVDALRSVDANTPIVSGGVAVDDPAYLYKLAKTGVLSKVNAIGIHPYRKDTFTQTQPTYRRNANSPENFAVEQAVYKNVLAATAVNKPIWNTEWGYSTVYFLDRAVYGDGNSPAALWRHGVLVSRMVLTQIAMNAPLITVYNLVDKGTDPNNKEHHFGLLKADFSEKPAYVGLRTLYSFAGNRTFKGYLPDVSPGLHVLRWDGAADRVFCMWVDDPAKPATVTIPSNATSVVRWDGVKVTPMTAANGTKTVSLYEVGGPVYVYVGADPKLAQL